MDRSTLDYVIDRLSSWADSARIHAIQSKSAVQMEHFEIRRSELECAMGYFAQVRDQLGHAVQPLN